MREVAVYVRQHATSAQQSANVGQLVSNRDNAGHSCQHLLKQTVG